MDMITCAKSSEKSCDQYNFIIRFMSYNLEIENYLFTFTLCILSIYLQGLFVMDNIYSRNLNYLNLFVVTAQ